MARLVPLPNTYKEIRLLKNDRINHLLELCNLSTEGTWGQKRRRLAMTCITDHRADRSWKVYATTANSGMPTPDDESIGVSGYRTMAGYKTGSSDKHYSFLIEARTMSRVWLPMMTEWEQVAYCGEDCRGASGGCPGFAPRLTSIHPKMQGFTMVGIFVDTAFIFDNYKGKPYTTINLQRLMKHFRGRVVKRVREQLGNNGFVLAGGSCVGKCNPCKVDECGQACTKPKSRTYSLEATGVDVDMYHHEAYGTWLPWQYKQLKGYLPTVLCAYFGFLHRERFDHYRQGTIVRDAIEADAHYEEPMAVSCSPKKHVMRVPAGCWHAGSDIMVYKAEKP